MQHTKPKSKSSTRGYQKYRCQYKHKPILTKLNNDAGYPQQILALNLSPIQSPDNFLEQNMQNLHNFFQDRIPIENTLLNKLMKRQVSMINPRRISEMKQLQYQLKSKTKMPLPHSIEIQATQKKDSVQFKKVKDRFHVNDKNKQLKQMYGTKIDFRHYERDNFRRGTQSHIQKRSKILKKQAYDNVFGPDPSSFSRTVVTKNSEPSSPSPRKTKSISSSVVQDQTSPRRRLRELIVNLNDFKNKLEQKSTSYPMKHSDQSPLIQQSQMVTLIQQMTQTYQIKSINRNVHKLQQVEDLRKINQQFYSHMLQHKEHRLNKRKQFISSTVNITPHIYEQKLGQYHTSRIDMDDQSQISVREEAEVEDSPEMPKRGVMTVVQRFNLLKKTLVRWAALIYIYGIQKSDIYIAFQSKTTPYEMEGSYAFFKCIKQGDLESVRTFIKANHCYVYDVDFHGRSAVSYACYYNQTQIAKEILGVGVNSDRLCNGGRTSLYYALVKRNVEIVKQLLQRGACPWSSPQNPYSDMLPFGENRQQLQCLFNNAKKVYLGMQIQSTIHQRRQCWQKNREKIVEDHWMSYDYC